MQVSFERNGVERRSYSTEQLKAVWRHAGSFPWGCSCTQGLRAGGLLPVCVRMHRKSPSTQSASHFGKPVLEGVSAARDRSPASWLPFFMLVWRQAVHGWCAGFCIVIHILGTSSLPALSSLGPSLRDVYLSSSLFLDSCHLWEGSNRAEVAPMSGQHNWKTPWHYLLCNLGWRLNIYIFISCLVTHHLARE